MQCFQKMGQHESDQSVTTKNNDSKSSSVSETQVFRKSSDNDSRQSDRSSKPKTPLTPKDIPETEKLVDMIHSLLATTPPAKLNAETKNMCNSK